MSGTLIVGASHAGIQLAASLRELGDRGPITLLSSESHLPYQRPPLSKEFLDTGNQALLPLRTPEWYSASGIDLRTDERVVDLSVASDGSGNATTHAGVSLAFDRLALTVGARTRSLEVPGCDLEGVCYLRRLDDALALRPLLLSAKRVVVVGGGYIGLEGAAVARSRGAHVTVVEAMPRLAPRAMPPTMSAFLASAHARRGTEIVLERRVVALHGRGGHVCEVALDDGSVLSADLVLIGVGVEPRTELAAQLGLHLDRGIVVDGSARTSRREIVAAGDCTVFHHFLAGPEMLRLESVQNAQAQARVAAATLVGQVASYDAVPWFWSDQDTLKIQSAGFAAQADLEILRGDPETEHFSLLHLADGRLVGIDAVNQPRDFVDARRALATGVRVPLDQAHDPGVRLRDIFEPSGSPAQV